MINQVIAERENRIKETYYQVFIYNEKETSDASPIVPVEANTLTSECNHRTNIYTEKDIDWDCLSTDTDNSDKASVNCAYTERDRSDQTSQQQNERTEDEKSSVCSRYSVKKREKVESSYDFEPFITEINLDDEDDDVETKQAKSEYFIKSLSEQMPQTEYNNQAPVKFFIFGNLYLNSFRKFILKTQDTLGAIDFSLNNDSISALNSIRDIIINNIWPINIPIPIEHELKVGGIASYYIENIKLIFNRSTDEPWIEFQDPSFKQDFIFSELYVGKLISKVYQNNKKITMSLKKPILKNNFQRNLIIMINKHLSPRFSDIDLVDESENQNLNPQQSDYHSLSIYLETVIKAQTCKPLVNKITIDYLWSNHQTQIRDIIDKLLVDSNIEKTPLKLFEKMYNCVFKRGSEIQNQKNLLIDQFFNRLSRNFSSYLLK